MPPYDGIEPPKVTRFPEKKMAKERSAAGANRTPWESAWNGPLARREIWINGRLMNHSGMATI